MTQATMAQQDANAAIRDLGDGLILRCGRPVTVIPLVQGTTLPTVRVCEVIV